LFYDIISFYKFILWFTQIISLHCRELEFLHNFLDFLFLEIGTSDVKLADLFGDNRFLSLNFKVELNAVLGDNFDGFAAHSLADCLEFGQEVFVVLGSEQTNDEIFSEENNALFLFL